MSEGGDATPPSIPSGPAFAITGGVLFVLALAFPALGTCPVSFAGGVTWLSNRDILLAGPIAPFFFEFGWYANIPFLIGLIALARSRPIRRWLLAIQAVLVLSTFFPAPMIGPAESSATICAWGLGFWIWFAAQAIVIVGGIFSHRSTPA